MSKTIFKKEAVNSFVHIIQKLVKTRLFRLILEFFSVLVYNDIIQVVRKGRYYEVQACVRFQTHR